MLLNNNTKEAFEQFCRQNGKDAKKPAEAAKSSRFKHMFDEVMQYWYIAMR